MNTSTESIVSGPGAGAQFTIIDYAVFIAMLVVSASIGVWFGCFNKGKQTTDDYLMGGRKMKTIPIAISLIASQLSAVSIMTIPVEAYTFGWQYILICPILVFIVIFVNYVVLPVFYNNNIDNCYTYLELRFDRTVRNVITTTFALVAFLILPVILFIPSLAFSQVSGFNLHLINAIVGFICVFYTMLGGIKAVVWTDVIQAFIMILSIAIVLVLGISRVGGVTEVWNRGVAGGRIIPIDLTLDLTTRMTVWNLCLGYFFMWVVHVSLNQSCVQRIVSLPTLQNSRRSLVYFGAGVVIVLGINCLTGVVMFAYYHQCDPVKAKIVEKYDKLMPFFVQEIVGHITGMSGLFVSCVFSASLSTVSAYMNSLAGIAYNDYIRPRNFFKHNDQNANLCMKILTCIYGTYCVLGGFIVERFASIFQLINTIAGSTVGAMFGVFTLGMLYPWANAKGAFYGAISSIVGMLWIISGAQYIIARGELKYIPLPTSIEQCPKEVLERAALNVTQALQVLNSTNILPPIDAGNGEGFSLYRMSFIWYSFVGGVIFWVVAIVVSHLTGAQDLSKLDINLLSPVIQRLMPKRYRHTELQVYTAKVVSPDANDLKEGTEWVWRASQAKLGSEKEKEPLT